MNSFYEYETRMNQANAEIEKTNFIITRNSAYLQLSLSQISIKDNIIRLQSTQNNVI
jgi:hypothetical protein